MFSWCFLNFKVFLALFDIWAENRMFEPRTGFSKIHLKASRHVYLVFSVCFKVFSIVRNLSREPDFQEFFKKPQNMFSWWFLSVSWYFTIIRHMSREPDFSTKNRIFKNFLKCLKACLVGVFWVFQSIFSIVRHLGREPDFWAENRIFKNFLKSLKTCLVGVFWVFQGILA